MRKLTLWVSEIDNDSYHYNIIGKTKREVIDKVNELEECIKRHYREPIKREVEFKDIFDLYDICTGEYANR